LGLEALGLKKSILGKMQRIPVPESKYWQKEGRIREGSIAGLIRQIEQGI